MALIFRVFSIVIPLACLCVVISQMPTISTETYLGRYFENNTINSTESMLTSISKSIFQCRHKCNKTLFCKAITYDKGARRNCKLYSINGLDRLLVEDASKDTMFITPADFGFFLSNYIKANQNILEVSSYGDKPASITFQLKTGLYRIKLIHISGGFICDRNINISLPFGCIFEDIIKPSKIFLVKDFRGEKLVNRQKFTNYEGDGTTTDFLETSEFYPLIHGNLYSFWYSGDFNDSYDTVYKGKTYFDFYVQGEH